MSIHRSHLNWQHKPHSSETGSYAPDHLAMLPGGQHINISSSPEFKGNVRAFRDWLGLETAAEAEGPRPTP